jgi:LmbE family N-acetylglucosaminyl deacetylase
MPQYPAEIAGPFNPAEPGTAERQWDQALHDASEWSPPSQPLLVVSPHPDDEVLGAGGLMRSHALAGRGVIVLSVTNGEAAYPDWTELHRIRRRELHDALYVLGAGTIDTIRLGIPDGHVKDHRLELVEVLCRLIARRPVLVAPYEFDGHPDHDATGAVCCDVAGTHRLTLVRYPIWTWHHATPASFAHCDWGRFLLDEATQRAKSQAIKCFTSQLRPWGRPPIVPNHVLPYFERPYEAFLL